MERVQDDNRSIGSEATTPMKAGRLYLVYLFAGAVCLFVMVLFMWQRVQLACADLNPFDPKLWLGQLLFGLGGVLLIMKGLLDMH